MKKIVNGILYDSQFAKKLVEVNNGNQIALYVTPGHNFFMVEGTNLFPIEKSEALQFLEKHKDKIIPLKFHNYRQLYFGIYKNHDPLKNATLILQNSNEALYLTSPGRQLYLVTPQKSEIISETTAVQWLESVQDRIDETIFSRILKNHFPTLRRA